ncbi:Pimeloyl-ACP methyl ester carboxylesterase [Limimonas halophila]|uniref:Pimeloyl-ACP methyl ester carboxylesterase n=1 Tax=Limimonas halophila TaxID=1082479 RepID=A0A1G7L3J8_9PROT|nr:alpha/beta hydrolase [Limimonas halophila]SDF44068.1 Pimeloyl-ACP methyl ester carboxylesterase [Limimonas halophila]
MPIQSPLTGNALVHGHRIATGVHGPADGTPVVLIHGTPSHSVIWRNVVPRLVEAGLRVHLFDLLGFGASERPLAADTSVAAQEALLGALLHHWGLSDAILIAHDIGGAVGLRAAVHTPERVRGLMLVDSVSYDSWPSETWRAIIRDHFDSYTAMAEPDFHAMLTRQLQMTVHDPETMTGEVLDAYLQPLSGPMGKVSFFHHQVRHYDSRYTEALTPALSGIRVPVHILWGADDRWQPVSYAHELERDIPGARLETIPDTGHFSPEDAPGAVADAVRAFARRHG